MNSSRAELAAALRERLDIIADEASRRDLDQHVARLQAVSEKIEALARSLPPPVEPQLVHYISRCSYDKALDLLEALQRPSVTPDNN